jgi:hypothetical protein
MAVKTPLRLVARKMGDLIRTFGATEGLAPDEFAIAGTFDEPTERFYLVVGSDRSLDQRRWHAGIINAIRKEFLDTSGVVLVVRNVTRIDQVYQEMVIGDNEIDVTEMF